MMKWKRRKKMFSALKTIAAELKRANDLKERDIKNKEILRTRRNVIGIIK